MLYRLGAERFIPYVELLQRMEPAEQRHERQRLRELGIEEV